MVYIVVAAAVVVLEDVVVIIVVGVVVIVSVKVRCKQYISKFISDELVK